MFIFTINTYYVKIWQIIKLLKKYSTDNLKHSNMHREFPLKLKRSIPLKKENCTLINVHDSEQCLVSLETPSKNPTDFSSTYFLNLHHSVEIVLVRRILVLISGASLLHFCIFHFPRPFNFNLILQKSRKWGVIVPFTSGLWVIHWIQKCREMKLGIKIEIIMKCLKLGDWTRLLQMNLFKFK